MERTLKKEMLLEEYDGLQEALLDPWLEKLLQVGRRGVELEGGKEILNAAESLIIEPNLNSYNHL